MKHLLLLVAMAITCVLVAIANVVIARTIGINFFTMKVWFVIPVGAGLVGMLGASGAILAARYFNIVPTILDAVFMVVIAAATMLLIYYLDYATLVLDDGRRASDLIDFASYVDLVLTKSHMRVGRAGQIDTGEVGQLGYALAAIEFAGFLVGGAATFLFIRGMARCGDCGSYLRKLKTKRTKELTFDETDKVIDLFNRGDLETVQSLLAWAPRERKLDSQKALITFDLLGCSKCKTEVITAKVQVFNGREWKDVPSLGARRNLVSVLSLRDGFGRASGAKPVPHIPESSDDWSDADKLLPGFQVSDLLSERGAGSSGWGSAVGRHRCPPYQSPVRQTYAICVPTSDLLVGAMKRIINGFQVDWVGKRFFAGTRPTPAWPL